MPRGKKVTAEPIIGKVPEAEVGLTRGKTEQTYYRWTREYGGLRTDPAKRLKDLEKENARLRCLLAVAERSFARPHRGTSGPGDATPVETPHAQVTPAPGYAPRVVAIIRVVGPRG
jgi:putative transposase